MANHSKKTLLAAAAGVLCASSALSQTLPTVVVSGRAADTPATIGGFGDTPVAKLPMQATLVGSELLQDTGSTQLSSLTNFDASVGDAYNSSGYISYLKVRGFDIDNDSNYRRDGLPINANTVLLLDNKSSLEVLKGTSGIQAGVSAPGGLVNLVVKRPTKTDFTTLNMGVSELGTLELGIDTSQHLSADVSLRVNASAARLKPLLRDDEGNRHLLAAALDWRVSPGTLVQIEGELSHQSQPSQPGFSLLGTALPDAKSIDPRTNLNNQPWSLPGVFDGHTASIRVEQQLNADWKAEAHLGAQRLKNDDRVAYPFGCTGTDGTYWASSYCPNGNFDLYDFRSNNERRNTTALDLSLSGKFETGSVQHTLTTGALFTRFTARFGGEAYNYVGTGNIDGSLVTPADPSTFDGNTNRDERSSELYLRDAISLTRDLQAFAGLRHTKLHRESAGTDGSDPTNYSQSFTTPWLGVSYALSSQHMLYASWGEGVESQVVPNRPDYGTAAGQPLPAIKSKQWEVGLKAGSNTVDWSVDLFDVRQPFWNDSGTVLTPDGVDHHRGVEAQADLKWQGGGLLASAMKLRARREDSAASNGLKPVNVPDATLKLHVRQDLMPGLQAQAGLVCESSREVLPDNSLQIPSWTRLDAALRYTQSIGRQLYIWRVGVDNITDHRAWRESPYQYAHVYLYPLAPRTWRASLEIQL